VAIPDLPLLPLALAGVSAALLAFQLTPALRRARRAGRAQARSVPDARPLPIRVERRRRVRRRSDRRR